MTLGNDNGTDGQTDGQTDRRTDRVRRIMRPPPREEGRIKIRHTVHRCNAYLIRLVTS